MTTDEDLTRIAAAIGKDYGYPAADATFSGFADLKVRWQRGLEPQPFIYMQITDYLKHASESTVMDIVDTVFLNIRGSDATYSQDAWKEITSEEFVKANLEKRRGRVFAEFDTEFVNEHLAPMAADVCEELGYSGPLYVGMSTTEPDTKQLERTHGGSVVFREVVLNRKMMQAPDYLQKACLMAGATYIMKGLKTPRPQPASYCMEFIKGSEAEAEAKEFLKKNRMV